MGQFVVGCHPVTTLMSGAVLHKVKPLQPRRAAQATGETPTLTVAALRYVVVGDIGYSSWLQIVTNWSYI